MWLILILGLAAAVCLFKKFTAKLSDLDLIPLCLPDQRHFLLGHAPVMGKDLIQGLRKLCVDGSAIDGISRFYITSQPCVGVLKAEHVKAALSVQSFRARIPLIGKHMDMLLGPRSLVQLMNNEWKLMRKLMAKAFNWEYLKNMVNDVNEVSAKFVKNMRETKHNQEVDIESLVKCITLDVIGKTAFGFDFDCCAILKPSPVADAFEYMNAECTRRQFDAALDPRSFFYSLPTASNKRYNAARKLIRGTINDLVASRAKQRLDRAFKEREHKDILKYFLDAHEEDGLAADKETLSDNLITLLFGGYDTSSITLAYSFYLIATHPKVEERALAEIDEVLGASGLPSYEDIKSRLPFCTAIINESLRLFPPAPLTVRTLQEPLDLRVDMSSSASSAAQSREITALKLPAGTMLYIPIWWIHRDPRNLRTPKSSTPIDSSTRHAPIRYTATHTWLFLAVPGTVLVGGSRCSRRWLFLRYAYEV